MRRENGRTKAKGFGLELVVPALCYSIRRGAVAAVLQFGGADLLPAAAHAQVTDL